MAPPSLLLQVNLTMRFLTLLLCWTTVAGSLRRKDSHKKKNPSLEADFFASVISPVNVRRLRHTHPTFLRDAEAAKNHDKDPVMRQLHQHPALDHDFSHVVAPLLSRPAEKEDDERMTRRSEIKEFLLARKRRTATSKEQQQHRDLQSTAECFILQDGSLACVLEGYPGPDFLTIFVDCPFDVTSVLDCEGCVIVLEDDLDDLDTFDEQCRSCRVCSDVGATTPSYDCANVASGECARQDCFGNCVNNVPSPPPPPPPLEDVTRCQVQGDGSVACIVGDFPRDGLELFLLDCPTRADSTLLDCDSCVIVEEGVIVEGEATGTIETTASQTCQSCTVCRNTIALDCANFDPEEVCAVQTCDSECIGGPPPLVPPTNPPTVPPTVPPTLPPFSLPTLPPTNPPTLVPTPPPTRPPTNPPTLITPPPTLPPTNPPTFITPPTLVTPPPFSEPTPFPTLPQKDEPTPLPAAWPTPPPATFPPLNPSSAAASETITLCFGSVVVVGMVGFLFVA